MTNRQLAKKSLKEKWYPIRDGENRSGSCVFCDHYAKTDCNGCILDDGDCAVEYDDWLKADIGSAEEHEAAVRMCKRLEKIAGITHD